MAAEDAVRLLQLIGNDCYRAGAFFYAAKVCMRLSLVLSCSHARHSHRVAQAATTHLVSTGSGSRRACIQQHCLHATHALRLRRTCCCCPGV